MINILPEKQKNKLIHEYRARLAGVVFTMVAIVGIVASLLLVPSYRYSVLKENIAEHNLELFNSQNPEMNIVELNNEISKTNKKLSFLVSKKSKYSISASVIEKLLSIRTQGISFTQILYSERPEGIATVQLLGVARDRTALHDFNQALSDDGSFSSVDLPISNFVKPTNIDFNFSLVLK